MRTSLNNSGLTFMIIGPPRAGTTIVASVFNSLKDGFCLGEPHWYYHAMGGNMSSVRNCCGKVAAHWGGYDGWGWQDILPRFIVPMANSKPFNIGGYKETFRIGHSLSENLLQAHADKVDFIFVVLRDPVLVHSSQRALGWREWDDPEAHNATYARLDSLATEYEFKSYVIVLEDFVQSPLDYLNGILPFDILGEFALVPTGHKFGDPAANRSGGIETMAREICLTDEEIKRHAEGRMIWWKHKNG